MVMAEFGSCLQSLEQLLFDPLQKKSLLTRDLATWYKKLVYLDIC